MLKALLDTFFKTLLDAFFDAFFKALLDAFFDALLDAFFKALLDAFFDEPGRAANRTPVRLERRILSTRRALREHSILGEYGLDAISLALQQDGALDPVPAMSRT